MSKREKLLYLLPQYEDHLRSIFVDWEHDEPWAYTTDEHRDFVDIMREYIASISE
jgi:DNA-directed RNA polymerase subunit F